MRLRGNTRQHVHQGEGGALPIEINSQVCPVGQLKRPGLGNGPCQTSKYLHQACLVLRKDCNADPPSISESISDRCVRGSASAAWTQESSLL